MELKISEYYLYYKIESNKVEIILEGNKDLTLGFGIGENGSGHMIGSDTISVKISNSNNYYVVDQYVPWTPHVDPHPWPVPVDDCQQDWTLSASIASSDTDLVCHYLSRDLDTGDEFDRVISDQSQNIIWSIIGRGKPLGSYEWHGSSDRGATNINFYGQPLEFDWTGHLFYDFMTQSVHLNDEKTQYVCQWIDLGEVADFDLENQTYRITGFEFIRSQINTAYDTTHHLLMYSSYSEFSYLRQPVITSPGGCSDSYGMLLYSWAVGGRPLQFDSDKGIVLDSSMRYMIFELHQDNYYGTKGIVDNSGVRIYYKVGPPQIEVETIYLGDGLVRFGNLENSYMQKSSIENTNGSFKSVYKYEATCPKECTENLDGNIYLILTAPHMHQYGRQIYLDHYRDGKLISTISRIDYWNFGFQRGFPLTEPYEIKPGDELVSTCIYDTSETSLDRVYFGGGSENEMCIIPAYYYPKRYLTLNDETVPFQNCSYAMPKFKDSEKYYAICGGFNSDFRIISTSNSKMGPIDNCNDLNLKFEKDIQCMNSKVKTLWNEQDIDIRCDCPVIYKETDFGHNCVQDRNKGWRKYIDQIKIGIWLITILIIVGIISWLFYYCVYTYNFDEEQLTHNNLDIDS